MGAPAWRDFIPEREQAIYERAGFGRKGGLGNRPAIVVIDVQYRTTGLTRVPIEEAMETFPTACGEVAWQAVDVIQRVLTAARSRGVPVLYPYVAPKLAYDVGRLGAKVPTILTVSDKGYEFVLEVQPREGDVLIPKKHPSAFFGTPMASYLIDLGVDTLIVCGCTTSGCVRGTVVDAFAYNFRVAVVEDGVYDRSQTCHLVNLFDMASKYADVMPASDVIAYLEALPARVSA